MQAPGMPPEIDRIEKQIGFQHRMWRAERIGWMGMTAIVLAALAGLWGGGGPLAWGEAEKDGLSVEWARIQRSGHASPLRIHLPPKPGAREAVLLLGPRFAEQWRIRNMAPEPLEAAAGSEGLRLVFRRDPTGAAMVAFHAEPTEGLGPRSLRLQASGRMLELPVWVWP